MSNPLQIDATWVCLPTGHLKSVEIFDGLMRDVALLGSIMRFVGSEKTVAGAILDGSRTLVLGFYDTDTLARAAVEEAADAITYATLDRLRSLPVPMRNSP